MTSYLPQKIILVDYTPELEVAARKILAVLTPEKPKQQWEQLELELEPKESNDE